MNNNNNKIMSLQLINEPPIEIPYEILRMIFFYVKSPIDMVSIARTTTLCNYIMQPKLLKLLKLKQDVMVQLDNFMNRLTIQKKMVQHIMISDLILHPRFNESRIYLPGFLIKKKDIISKYKIYKDRNLEDESMLFSIYVKNYE
jgi:hypothetical protein